ncbi:MAG TPA: ISAs1 family transposase [Patescibacteria group bacterium]
MEESMPKRKTVDKEYRDLTQEIDVKALQENVRTFFANFQDLRRSPIYPAWYLILVMLSGYLSGCNTIADIAHFAELRGQWLNTLLGLKFDRLSYDTIWWFLVRVKPAAFQDLLSQWLSALPSSLKDQVLAVDGKRLRGVSDNEHITHLVNLFAVDSRITIAQERVPDKECERRALSQLLESVDVTGAIITMDAHYTYKPDLQGVLAKGADFIVGIKGNQGNLEAEAINYFNQAHNINFASEEFQCHTTVEKDHGRIETRHVCVSHDLDWLPQKDEWNLKALIEIRSERVIGDKIQNGVLYYGASREGTPGQFAKWIRSHWGIENGLNYIMDVVFEEDKSLANVGNAAENISLLRRLSMNVIKTFDPGRGITDARRSATYEPAYLSGLLSRLFTKKCQ